MNDLNQDKEQDKLDLNSDSPQSPVNTGEDENKGLEDFVAEATKTKADAVSEEQEIKQAEAKPKISEEQAAEMALKGLDSILAISSKMSGKQIDLLDEGKMIFAAMTTPLFLKYGDKIQKAMASPSNVDLDSWMPEVLATTAVVGISIPIYLQVKAPVEVEEEKADGDKSEQPA